MLPGGKRKNPLGKLAPPGIDTEQHPKGRNDDTEDGQQHPHSVGNEYAVSPTHNGDHRKKELGYSLFIQLLLQGKKAARFTAWP